MSKAAAMAAVSVSHPKEKGNNTFQPRRISWSYLYRGKAARVHIKKNKKTMTLSAYHNAPGIQCNSIKFAGGNQPPQKRQVHKLLMIIMLAYSPKKKRAKPIEEYSTLKPATNSASASGRVG